MRTQNYNPDVLTCLANLSNDEVFTPPAVVNKMLDMLPAELWSNPDARFLDPVSKTGVFLREIAKRLMEGLKEQIPDLQQRADHIFGKQLYGLAITELTALMSRRSVYCSKYANGRYSVCTAFDDEQGNIRYEPTSHTWQNGRCIYCGASQEVYDRGGELESHAYRFIHTDNPKKLYPNMKFDVIIGNPPYQLNDGGFNKSASPLYHRFVEQAIKLKPRYLTMIIPSRWFGGGKGLEEFRKSMLNDSHIRTLVDYENASECFPGVDIAGGVCYFLWDRDNAGLCNAINVRNEQEYKAVRSLNEFETYIRHNEAVNIIHKVIAHKEKKMSSMVSSSKPFGLRTFVRPQESGDITLRWQNGEGPYNSKEITVGREMIDQWKVITSYVGYDHAGSPGKDGKRKVFSKIDTLPPKTICTETYLVIGAFDSENEARNLIGYMKTLFFRFLVSQFMYSHHITKDSYRLVPIQDFTQEWTDEKLYAKYGLTDEEINFIESMIRPME